MHPGNNVEPQTLKSLIVRKLVFADEARVDAKRGLHVGGCGSFESSSTAAGPTRLYLHTEIIAAKADACVIAKQVTASFLLEKTT